MDCSLPGYMGFSRQEYWSGLPFPSPGDLPNRGIEPRSPTLQAGRFFTEDQEQWKSEIPPCSTITTCSFFCPRSSRPAARFLTASLLSALESQRLGQRDPGSRRHCGAVQTWGSVSPASGLSVPAGCSPGWAVGDRAASQGWSGIGAASSCLLSPPLRSTSPVKTLPALPPHLGPCSAQVCEGLGHSPSLLNSLSWKISTTPKYR